MNESILLSIKRLLGVNEEYTHFDIDIITHINSTFFNLVQLGVLSSPFRIEGNEECWSDLSPDIDKMELVKSYIYLKVRKVFDPPTSGILMEAMNQLINEAEWRLNVYADPGEEK